MKIINMKIYKSDMKFNPEEMKSTIELALAGDNNLFLDFKTSTDNDNLIKLYNVFDASSINDLKNRYCRAFINEKTNQVEYIKNIVYDYDLQIDKEN